jgi:hypothetical protein
MTHRDPTEVKRTFNECQTEVKHMLDEKAGWQNSMQDGRAQDSRTQDNDASSDVSNDIGRTSTANNAG